MSTTRDRLMAKHRTEASTWAEAERARPVVSEDDFDTMQRTRWLDAARYYDPAANLAEELVLRLHGAAAHNGGLDLNIGAALLKPLQEMVTSAVVQPVKFLLVGVSEGSTVLHFQPQMEDVPESIAQETPAAVADAALRIINLISSAESGESTETWGGTERGLGDIARVLEHFDLTADVRWLDSSGSVRSSTLTERGRANVLAWHAPVPTTEPVRHTVTGRITELREGVAKVKTGTSKKSKAHVVNFEPGQLIGLHLEFGEQVTFTVEERPKFSRSGDVTMANFFISLDSRAVDSDTEPNQGLEA